MKRVLTICVILFTAVSIYGQTSSLGKDFWLSFGNNDNPYINLSLQVRIITMENTQATIVFTETGEEIVLSLAAGTVYTYNLTDAQKQAVYSNVTGKSLKSIHIQTDQPVAVFAINMLNSSTDATGILPINALDEGYYHLSYFTYRVYKDGYTIVAVEDNTILYEDGVELASLNKGEVYSSYFCIVRDIYYCEEGSGKHITTNRPVAYFTTNTGTTVPNQVASGECLYQQLNPESSWGNRFYVPVTTQGVERVRIVASQDNTVISHTGGTLMAGSLTLNRGEWAEIEINASQNGCYIEANNPVGVASYLTSYAYIPGNNIKAQGNPSMAWIPPIEQFIGETVAAPFLAAGSSKLSEHYFLIVTPTPAKDLTEIKQGNGVYASLTDGTWHDHPSGYSYYTLPLKNIETAYWFKNPQGLLVLNYGLGSAESYYYASASATFKLNAYFEANAIHYQTLNGDTLCSRNIEVSATVKYPMDATNGHLQWLVDGEEQPAFTDSLHWTKNLPSGAHAISMIVKNQYGIADSMSASFVIAVKETTLNDTTCQNEPYDRHGFSLPSQTETGLFTHQLELVTEQGCDSVVYLNLQVHPVEKTILYDTICQNGSYYFKGEYLNVTGTYRDTIPTVNGCDSLVTLNLEVTAPIFSDTLRVLLCAPDSFYFKGKYQREPGIYCDTLTSVFTRCDSIATLDLTVEYVRRDTINSIACQRKPYFFKDESITLAGIYQDTLKSRAGCDSLITVLIIEEQPVVYQSVDTTICEGKDYYLHGNRFNATGLYQDTLLAISGCDSLITTLNLTVKPLGRNFLNESVCYGGSYTFNGQDLMETGVYTDTLPPLSPAGCDSIITLSLTVFPKETEDKGTFTVCEGESFTLNGKSYTEAGVYEDTLARPGQCPLYLRIVIRSNCPKPLHPASYFTPDGDGINDRWEIVNLDVYEQYTVEIYDRFGKLLARYENDYPGWDGVYRSKPLPATDYWYVISIEEIERVYSGHFSLIR